jgi:alanine racemase
LLNWVEISAEALRNNVGEFRRRIGPDAKLGAVVKANAYGHGIDEVAPVVRDAGADWLCVNNLEEGIRLREAGHELPVLVMGYVPLERLEQVVIRRLRPVLYNRESVEKLDRLVHRNDWTVPVHVKVETGTNRQGIEEKDLPALVDRIRGSDGLELEGVTTHFANIEDTTDHSFARTQIANYQRVVETITRHNGRKPMLHAACSAATLLFTETHLDLVRVGISLYGLWPSRETYVSYRELGKPSMDLQPVMTWKTRIAQLKTVPEGGFVGYGCTYRATRPTRIAVLPVGYSEGYDRGLSNIAHVLINGRRAPVRGRVCMNMTMVDVTDIPAVSLEDEVVLLGAQDDERVSAEQLAAWCGTISYEIVSRIHPALPRVLV